MQGVASLSGAGELTRGELTMRIQRPVCGVVLMLASTAAWSQERDGSQPIRRTTREIMRQAALRERPSEVRDREIKKAPIDWRHRRPNPRAPLAARWPEATGPLLLDRPVEPLAPQTVSTPNFTSVTTDDAPTVPPDSMGAIGATQFLTTVNGRVRVHAKNNGAVGALDSDDFTFWSPVVEDLGGGFVTDPRVRYDRLTDRWFLVILDIPSDAGTNGTRILLAVSDGPTITGSTVWQYFFFDQDLAPPAGQTGCLSDYPTLGVDANALYIGANVFCGPDLNSLTFDNTSLWVVRKSSLLNPATPANLVSTAGAVNAFRGLLDGSFQGLFVPHGADNYDPAATRGFVVGVDGAFFGLLVIREVMNPGSGSPSLGANQFLTVPATTFPQDVQTPGGGPALDSIDDRLMAAHVRNGRLWTSHQIEVNASGIASTTGNRNGVRWYEINVSGAPSLVQSGTVFDPAASNPMNFWMGTVMVSGQGHAALGFTAANALTRPAAATVGRLAGDALGTTQGTPATYKAGEADYVFSPARWGDYSMTSVDPCDDMTMWTIQEYADTPNLFPVNWGTQVVRLLAPGPAVPNSAVPPSIQSGQPSLNVTINASATSGRGFYDTPASGISAACRTRIGASVGGGVIVNSVTLVDADTVMLNLDTTGASLGPASVTVTNPDGQFATGTNLLTVLPPGAVVSGTKTASGTFEVGGAISYSVVLTNSGSASQGNNPGNEFTDTLPASLSLVSANASSGTVTTAGNTVNWNGSLAVSGSVTITINATINAGTEGAVVSNQGTINYDADNNGTNEASAQTDDPGQPGTADPTVFFVGSGAVDFFTLPPCRVLDTRNPPGPLGGPALNAQADRTFTVTGTCGIPPTAKAISVNLAVTQPTMGGNLRLRPGGVPVPLVSSINYSTGLTRSNNAVVSLNASGQIAVFCAQTSGSVHFILDVNGYFE
jgi:uncharacterized repeat protein (TIGR01451 family)